MWTIPYKGYWIHGDWAKDECQVQSSDYSHLGTRKTLRAAKIAVTRHQKSPRH